MALVDSWPPPVLAMLERHAPASSLSWTVHLLDTPEQCPEGWWWFRSETIQAGSGYATTQQYLYRPDGKLALWSEQLVTVFDSKS